MIYLASPLAHLDDARRFRDWLQPHIKDPIISRWHDGLVGMPLLDKSQSRAFEENKADLERARILIALTFTDRGRETYVEIGRFLALGKPVVWYPHTKLVPREDGGPCLALEASNLVYRANTSEEVLEKLVECEEDLWLARGRILEIAR